MKLFVFITHKTPAAKQSLLRKKLYELYLNSLNAQTYTNWKVLIIGEEERQDDRFKVVKIDAGSEVPLKEQLKKIYDRADVISYLEQSDFIVKLDDDDIISPSILETMSKKDFDICFDRYHTFYDVTSGVQTQQSRHWIPSTCIHKTQHALAPTDAAGNKNYFTNSVLYTNHADVWHVYYADKKQVVAEKEHPVYLRVLSPTSITAGAKKLPLDRVEDVDFNDYYRYLKTFGYWQTNYTRDFDQFKSALESTWKIFSGTQQVPIKGISGVNVIMDKIKNYAKRAGKLF
ncbi:MAG: hypothetical protein V4635_13900 [Bacteroidota bacterium]